VTAVEYALLAPAFLLLVLGVVDMGRLAWTQVTIDYAASAAARCAAVDTVTCGTTAQIQAYASANAFGLDAPASDFTVTSPACGWQVSASYSFTFALSWIVGGQLNLTATSCTPPQS